MTVTGGGVTLQTAASGMLRRTVTFAGTAPPRLRGATVAIELSGPATRGRWMPVASSTIAPDGSFSAIWQASHTGRLAVRAAIVSASRAARAATATPALTITVYRPSYATQYGPGFYGHRTACGQRLRPSTIGVANLTLRCGTLVSFYYRGRTIVVPVIDRGPYGTRASWDLTMATAQALGMPGTGGIGAVSVPAGQTTAAAG